MLMMGQLIAKTRNYVSANVFAPASEEIVGIEKLKNNLGYKPIIFQIKHGVGKILTLFYITTNCAVFGVVELKLTSAMVTNVLMATLNALFSGIGFLVAIVL